MAYATLSFAGNISVPINKDYVIGLLRATQHPYRITKHDTEVISTLTDPEIVTYFEFDEQGYLIGMWSAPKPDGYFK